MRYRLILVGTSFGVAGSPDPDQRVNCRRIVLPHQAVKSLARPREDRALVTAKGSPQATYGRAARPARLWCRQPTHMRGARVSGGAAPCAPLSAAQHWKRQLADAYGISTM